jgi:hypothetical protein
VTKADVAELVDARDLKFFAPIEAPNLFWKTHHPNTVKNVGAKRVLENIDTMSILPRPLLLFQPSLSRQRVAHGLIDLRAPCAEAGLHQVPANGVPVRRKAVRRVDSDQYECADIGKRS